MNQFFSETPGHYPPARPAAPDEFARSDEWTITTAGDTFVVRFWSGELVDRERQLTITEAEAHALKAGTTSLQKVLLAHGAL